MHLRKMWNEIFSARVANKKWAREVLLARMLRNAGRTSSTSEFASNSYRKNMRAMQASIFSWRRSTSTSRSLPSKVLLDQLRDALQVSAKDFKRWQRKRAHAQ